MTMATSLDAAAERGKHPVLIVAADAATRAANARTLRAAGFPVIEAATGAQGVSLAADGFHAIVLDVEMPDLDGFRFCRTLRANQNTARLPVLFMSALGISSEHARAALDAGADACLVYPVDASVLLAMTQALTRARAAELATRQSEAAAPDMAARALAAATGLQAERDAIEHAAWRLLDCAVNDRTLAALNAILTSTRAQSRLLSALRGQAA